MRPPCVTLAVAFFIFGFGSTAISQAVTPLQDDRYAPSRFGIPESIGGYYVFAILTEDIFACMRPGEIRLILQSPEPTIKDRPRGFPHTLIEQELKAQRLTEFEKWDVSIVGPGTKREQLLRQFEESSRFFETHDCPTPEWPKNTESTLASPDATCSSLGGSEFRCNPPEAGYAIIQNLIDPKDVNNNGQSVILIAPDFRNGQQTWLCSKNDAPAACSPAEILKGAVDIMQGGSGTCATCGGYSAFLNNGLTDKGYFLQVGLYFTSRPTQYYPLVRGNRPVSDCVGLAEPDSGNPFSPNGIGWVVWAGAQTQNAKTAPLALAPRALCVPYIAGHHYYTTIAYTSGTWWTCAADTQDTTTYKCQQHKGATGTRLINSRAGTNVFAENWNKNPGRPWGFPPQWVAYGARIYVGGIGHSWLSEAKLTEHACKDAPWPPNSAIVASSGLKNDEQAYFNTYYLPPYCE